MDNQIVPVEQKLVGFNGAELLGVKANDGKIYVGVRWVCDGIGLSRGQANNEVNRVQTDIVLREGARNFVLQKMENGKGSANDALTVELEFLPLWLAKISITPSMQRNQPELTDKLVSYQLNAKSVLADAFIHNKPSYMIEDSVQRAEKWIEEQLEKKELQSNVIMLEQRVKENAAKVSYYDVILQSKSLVTISQIAKDYGLTGNELNKILKEQKVQFKQGDQWLLYKKYADKGYTQSETHNYIHTDGTQDVRMHTKWTQRGRIFIHELLCELGIRPNIEKEYFDAN